jgi:hypothetical protein
LVGIAKSSNDISIDKIKDMRLSTKWEFFLMILKMLKTLLLLQKNTLIFKIFIVVLYRI